MLLVWSSRDTRKRRGLLWKTSVWIHTKMADACQTHSPFSLSVTQINVLKMGVFCFLTGTARSVETNTCSTVGRTKGVLNWNGHLYGKQNDQWLKKNSKKQTNKQNRDVVTLKLVQLTHDAAETKIAVSPSHSNNVLTTVRGFCSWKPRSDSDLQHRGQLRALTPGCLPVCRTAAAENTVKITPGGSTGHIRFKKTDQRSLIPLILSNKAITDCTEASIPQFLLVPLHWIHPCKQSRTECQQRLSEKKQNIKKPKTQTCEVSSNASNHAVWVHLEQSQSSAGPKRADYICDASQLCSHTPADNGQQLQPLFPPPAVSVHRNTRVCAGNAPRASAKRLENKRVIVHLPSCHTAAGPGVAKCWTHARRKSKKTPQKKTSETAIKSLEELSRVMRCRQSIPSFYPHVKSAPPLLP